MISYIEKDSDGVIYCSDFHDGRIEKVFLKESKNTIYVCEECEATWATLENIFEAGSCTGLTEYLEKNNLIEDEETPEWDKILIAGDFLQFSEVKSIVEKHHVKVVELG